MSAALTVIDSRRIEALHAQGLSTRQVARQVQLSASAVHKRLRKLRSESAVGPPPTGFPPGDVPPRPDEGPPGFDPANIRRCRGCGALVYLWPCLACCLADEATAVLSPSQETRHDFS